MKIFSDEWWDILDTALKTASDLNIEIGIFNSPGWSQSGGQWIKPEQSMRYLSMSEYRFKGGQRIIAKLSKPSAQFQDVKVIAFKAPYAYQNLISALTPSIKTSVPVKNVKALIDGNRQTEVSFPAVPSLAIDFETTKDFTTRSVVVYPAHRGLRMKMEVQVKEGDRYKTLKTFLLDRSNPNLNVGFDPYGPVTVSIPPVTAKSIRVVFFDVYDGFGVTEVELSSSPRVDNYIEKTLAKMYQTPLPYWNEYQWAPQAAVKDKNLLIDPATVIDISSSMQPDGTLIWEAPAGDWIVMRTGMQPTLVTNTPASPEATGLEVDKMSKEHIESHFDAFLGEIIRRIPPEHRKTWRVTVEDSYETGGQNWTDGLIDKFKDHFGYDPLPYLPVLKGMVVGSQDQSDRFLWDLRRFIADRVAYDYVAGLREVSHKHGLHTWLENYGHWGFPGEFLQYGGQSDEIGGEFWSEGELGNIENRAASSAAHIYGKNKVSAESFTAGGKPYVRYPAMMKQRGDRFFTEGINNTLLHVFIQQPTDDILPGINADFGNEFNRHNTWFNYLDLFTSYLKRCNFILQQGKYVADVAYFIGEDAPKMTGVTDPALPYGYSFDYINGEVLRDRVKVKDGKLILPDGMTYRLLVLPKLETMRPELLIKIKDLVNQGATILGPAPKRSPSLQDYPSADQEVMKLVDELWGSTKENGPSFRVFGKGKVLTGMDMQTALNSLKIIPDFTVKPGNRSEVSAAVGSPINSPGGSEVNPILFIHRKLAYNSKSERQKLFGPPNIVDDQKELPGDDIYFLSNQSPKITEVNAVFRVTGRTAELWDPVTGTTRALPQYTEDNARTATIPLKFESLQSLVIVFRNNNDILFENGRFARVKQSEEVYTGKVNFPSPVQLQQIVTGWKVDFSDQLRGPVETVTFDTLSDWTTRPEDDIKYYSGTAIYRNTFIAGKPGKGEHIYLNLGDVKVMAKVKINGKDVGGVWTAPWQVDITSAVKSGTNQVEISVVNTWVNRLIGDSKLPVAQRKTWTSVNPYRPDSKLEHSGLNGPVTIQRIQF